MILVGIGLGLLTLIFLFVYKCVIAPRRLMNWHKIEFQKKGYKVLDGGFNLFNPTFIQSHHKKGEDDFSYLKQNYPDHDIAIFNLGNEIVVEFGNNVNLIQEFTSKEKMVFYQKHRVFLDSFSHLFRNSLGSLQGKQWQVKRKLLSSLFNFDFIKALTPRISKICDQSFDKVEKQFGNQNEQELSYCVREYGLLVGFRTISECFLGTSLVGEKLEGQSVDKLILSLIDQCAQLTTDLLYILLGNKFLSLGLRKKDKDFIHKIKLYSAWGKEKIKELMEKNEKINFEGKPSDLIAALYLERKQGKSDLFGGEDEIFYEFNSFLGAGTETTSLYISMMIYLISLHPQVEAKVRKEIEQCIGDRQINYERLKECTYLDYVQYETTRYYGPANGIIPRVSKQDHYILDIPIKKGIVMSYKTLGFHFSPEYYEDPQIFNPDRWKNAQNIPPNALMGFNGGPRTCIGKHLARVEAKIAVIKFFQRYKKIEPKKNFVLRDKFAYQPEYFETKLTKA